MKGKFSLPTIRKTRWINDHNESLLKKIIPLIRKEIDKKATYHWWGPEKSDGNKRSKICATISLFPIIIFIVSNSGDRNKIVINTSF